MSTTPITSKSSEIKFIIPSGYSALLSYLQDPEGFTAKFNNNMDLIKNELLKPSDLTVNLVDKNGNPIEGTSSSSPLSQLPSNFPPFSEIYAQVRDMQGTSATISIRNDKGFSIAKATLPLKSRYTFEVFPGRLDMNFPGTLYFKSKNSSAEYTYVSLPGYIDLLDSDEIEYKLWLDDGSKQWLGPFTMSFALNSQGTTKLC